MMKKLIIALAIASISLSPAAQDKTFNYVQSGAEKWGTQKKENYDIAIQIEDPALVGSAISHIEVPLPENSGIGDCSIWLSSDLKLDNRLNAPDILSSGVEISGGKISLDLREPYTITEAGVYVGYSFKVQQLNEVSGQPVSVALSDNPKAFFVHTSRSYLSWGRFNLQLAADITVGLSNPQFEANAVMVASVEDENMLPGEVPSPTVMIRNHGNDPVRSIGYSYTINGRRTEGSMDFADPLLPYYTENVPLVINMPSDAVGEAGSYPWTFSVEEVNGVPNPDPGKTAGGCVYVFPFRPSHRPLVEEYTGLDCGWCPRGAIGMELMEKKFGDDFVCVAYHTSDDVMSIEVEYPTTEYYAPSANIDRTITGDPYNGLSEETCKTFMDGIGRFWEQYRSLLAPCDVSVSADWTDESRQQIEAHASAVFARPYSGVDFRFVYFLTANGLCGDDAFWIQKNYFSGDSKYLGTDLASLVALPAKVEGMKFNDVLVYTPEVYGTPGSIPAEIPWLETMSHSCALDIDKAVNVYDMPLVQDKDALSVVVAVVDAGSGRILNCAKTPVGAGAGVGDAGIAEKEVISESYYDLLGRPAHGSASGICVKVTTYSDGTVSSGLFGRK